MTSSFKKLLHLGLEADLRRLNPWWADPQAAAAMPEIKRWAFEPALRRLKEGLAAITLIRGPRQVGKSTMLLQMVEQLLAEGVNPKRIFYVQFDELPLLKNDPEPILRLADWYEQTVLHSTFNQETAKGHPVYWLLDEVQNLSDWHVQLKFLVDANKLRVMVTGSSSLRIERGRDSLAGRIHSLDIGTLRLWEIAEWNHLGLLKPLQTENNWQNWLSPDFWREVDATGKKHHSIRDRAFAVLSARGSYPIAHVKPSIPWAEMAEQLVETVIQRVLQHDAPLGKRPRKKNRALFEEVCRLAFRYAGQSPRPDFFAEQVNRSIQANTNPLQVRRHLDILHDTLLVRLVDPLEFRIKRTLHLAKICLCDHALRAAWLGEIIPLESSALDQQPRLTDLAGRLVESLVGYYLASLTGLSVAHLPSSLKQPEIDFILTIGYRRIPVEVKYQRRIDPIRDTHALRLYLDNPHHEAPLGLLITREDHVTVPDARIIPIALKSLLLVR